MGRKQMNKSTEGFWKSTGCILTIVNTPISKQSPSTLKKKAQY